MTRENYFKLKKKLIDSGLIYKVEKKGKYITIVPDFCEDYWNVGDLVEEVFDKVDSKSRYYYIKNSNSFGISTKFGCLDVIDYKKINSTIYSIKLKIS